MTKPLFEVLSYKNWRKWFRLVELYLTREGWDFVIHQTEKEYCIIEIGDLSLRKRKARTQGGELSIERQRQYRKATAKAFYIIFNCIDSLNRDLIDGFAIVKEKWN
jgi:hypothetical protein